MSFLSVFISLILIGFLLIFLFKQVKLLIATIKKNKDKKSLKNIDKGGEK